MIPTNSSISTNGCDNISSNCVVWQGPDIACIDLCSGDTISEVTKKIGDKVCQIITDGVTANPSLTGLDLSCLDLIPKKFKNPILIMGGAGKPEHFTEALNHEKISGVITANLFNFLGKGLQEARNFSIKKNIRLIKFEGVNI